MKSYKYADKNRNVVLKIDDDGKCRVSFLVDGNGFYQKELKKWLEKGSQIEAEDLIPEPPKENPKQVLEKLGITVKELKQILKDEPEE